MQSRWYKSGWTDERRCKQREAIQRWKPWEKSTGPRTMEGKAEAARNGRLAVIKTLSAKDLIFIIRRL